MKKTKVLIDNDVQITIKRMKPLLVRDERPLATVVAAGIRDIVSKEIEHADSANLIGAVHNSQMVVTNITAAIMNVIRKNGMVKEY